MAPQRCSWLALLGVALIGGRAQAEDAAPLAEQPEILTQPGEERPAAAPSALDLANLVTSAAKSTTTIQEAPAIVTVVTAAEIRRRGFRTIDEVMRDVPGWQVYGLQHGDLPVVMARGTVQGALVMRDGISLFSPWEATTVTHRAVPIESVKRLEIVTGPGGVLWGANSFLGVLNVITKDAEDVDGIEVDAGYGDGRGDQSVFRGYGMLGKRLGSLRLFQHVSYETYLGPEKSMLQNTLSSPAPQPNGPVAFGPELTSRIDRSWILNVDGKLGLGPVSLIYNLPFGIRRHPLGFAGNVVHTGVPDQVRAGEIPGLAAGANRPYNPTSVTDPHGVGRDHAITFWDRYAILEYRDRLASDHVGLSAKGYFVDFDRDFEYLNLFPPSGLLPGGVNLRGGQTVRRFGATLDVDVGVLPTLRLLGGAEAFHESVADSNVEFPAPDPSRLPFACPRNPDGSYVPGPGLSDHGNRDRPALCPTTFVFDADRTVVGGFLDAQWRAHPTLTLDAGVRVQGAGGKRPYDTQVLSAGALVWNFAPRWHLKLNYAEGFRPPVFNNTDTNGEAIQYAGSPDLVSETSQAGQIEVNTRLLQSGEQVRELALRADYSYTVLDKTIVVADSQYRNSGKRGIHNGELLARAFLDGGHQLSLGYTYLAVATEDRGLWRSLPNHWVSAGAVLSVLRWLDVNANLLVTGALEDPNRIPDPQSPSILPGLHDAYSTDLTVDRIPPTALLQLGVRAKGLLGGRLDLAANAYNVLDQRWFYFDGFYELSPRIEMLPNPGEGFNFFAHATLRH